MWLRISLGILVPAAFLWAQGVQNPALTGEAVRGRVIAQARTSSSVTIRASTSPAHPVQHRDTSRHRQKPGVRPAWPRCCRRDAQEVS